MALESVALLAVLLVAVLLGAIVALLAVRLTQDASSSIQQYSKDVMSLSLESLASNEREATRDRSLAELAKEFEKLNVTVGQLYFQIRNGPPAERTILTRPMQVGEASPGAPPVRVVRPQTPLPPEGLEPEAVAGSTPAAAQVRATAFAKPT